MSTACAAATCVHRGKRHEYEWVTGLPLNGSPDAPLINFIQFRIIKAAR